MRCELGDIIEIMQGDRLIFKGELAMVEAKPVPIEVYGQSNREVKPMICILTLFSGTLADSVGGSPMEFVEERQLARAAVRKAFRPRLQK